MAKILVNFADFLHTEERKKQNTYGGIGYYRQIKPSEQIKGHNVRVIGKEIAYFDSLEEQWDTIFKENDVFWTSYFSDDRNAGAIFYNRDKYKKKVIIDLDDNYLDVPESNLSYEKYKAGTKDRAFLSTILYFADALTVSTEPLKQRLLEHFRSVEVPDKKIYVIPNMNDIKDWVFPLAEKEKDKIVIGYSGSNSHQDDLKMVMPSIAKIMKKYKNVHFQLIGAIAKDKVKEYFGRAGFDDDCLSRIGLLPATPTFKEFPEYLLSQKWDIGIAPLVDTAFTRSKSHIKWMEYSMMKIPTVASRVYPYFMDIGNRKTIQHGETGYTVRDNEWEKYLSKLIEDKTLREDIGMAAYEYVRDNWQYKDGEINDTVSVLLKDIKARK